MAGMTTRRPSTEVTLPSNNNVWPISIDIKYKAICLCADVLTINGIKFLTTVVPTINSTATVLNKSDRVSIQNTIKPIISVYNTRGFDIIDPGVTVVSNASRNFYWPKE